MIKRSPPGVHELLVDRAECVSRLMALVHRHLKHAAPSKKITGLEPYVDVVRLQQLHAELGSGLQRLDQLNRSIVAQIRAGVRADPQAMTELKRICEEHYPEVAASAARANR